MATEALLWQIQGVHERIMRIMAAADREITAKDPQNASSGGQQPHSPLHGPFGSHVASVLVRTRRNLSIQLIDERKALRSFALSAGVPESRLPPSFDNTCRFVPAKTSPIQTPQQKDSGNDFEVRALTALKQRLATQLSGLLRVPIQAGVKLSASDVIHPTVLAQAQSLQNDMEKVTQRLMVATTPIAQTPIMTPRLMSNTPTSTSFASASHDVTVELGQHRDELTVRKQLFPPTPDTVGKKILIEHETETPAKMPVGEQSRVALNAVQRRLAALLSQQPSVPPPTPPQPQEEPAFSGLDRLFNKIFSGSSPERSLRPEPTIDPALVNECEQIPEVSPLSHSSEGDAVNHSDLDSDGDDEEDGGIDEHMAPARAAVAAAVAAANSFSEFLSTSGRQYVDADILSPGKVDESGDEMNESGFSVSSELNASDVSEPEPVETLPIAMGRPRLIVPSSTQSPVKSLKEHRPVLTFDPSSPVDMASPPPLPRVVSRLRPDNRVSSYPPPLYPASSSEFATPGRRGQTLGTAVESPIGASPLSPMRPGDSSIMFLDVDASFLLTPQRHSPQPS